MKHIFTVHSPITFLITYAVIQHLKLSDDEVIILSSKYDVPLQKFKIYPAFNSVHTSFWSNLQKINLTKFADKYINQITENNDFIAYIDLMSYNQRILVTHPNCKVFHFIEEGNSSYRKNDTLEDMTWDKRKFSYRSSSIFMEVVKVLKRSFRGYTDRLISIPYSFSSYHDFPNVQFFGFSSLAFPQIPYEKKIIVKIEEDEQLDQLAGGVKLENALIWVDGSNSAFTGLSEDVYHNAINRAIDYLQADLHQKVIYLKFRPRLKNYKDQFLYKILMEKGYKVNVLPDNLILECVFINSNNCQVIGNLSSALFYASIFGHQAYSIYSLFEQQAPTIFDQMPGYWENVKKL